MDEQQVVLRERRVWQQKSSDQTEQLQLRRGQTVAVAEARQIGAAVAVVRLLRLHENGVAEQNCVFHDIAVRLSLWEAAEFHCGLPAEVREADQRCAFC